MLDHAEALYQAAGGTIEDLRVMITQGSYYSGETASLRHARWRRRGRSFGAQPGRLVGAGGSDSTR
jgi:hypothetical protein